MSFKIYNSNVSNLISMKELINQFCLTEIFIVTVLVYLRDSELRKIAVII